MKPEFVPKPPTKTVAPEADLLADTEGKNLESQFQMFLEIPASPARSCSGGCLDCRKKTSP